MVGYAIWFVKCTQYIHESDEPDFQTIHWKSVVVYFDDILIYSGSTEEHIQHLREVLLILRQEQFYAAKKKCVFMTDRVLFLGYVLSKEGIQVHESKVEVSGVGHSPRRFLK